MSNNLFFNLPIELQDTIIKMNPHPIAELIKEKMHLYKDTDEDSDEDPDEDPDFYWGLVALEMIRRKKRLDNDCKRIYGKTWDELSESDDE